MTHYIFEQHEGGFFSNFNKIITFLSHNKPGKITWNLQGQPFGAFAYNCGEVFSNLFKTVIVNDNITVVYVIKEFTHLEYTGKNANNLYKGENDWRISLNKTFKKYIHPTERLKNRIQDVDKKISEMQGVKIGILKRNQLLKCEQVTNSMPTLSDYFNKINNISNNCSLYLSVDNHLDLEKFKSAYGCYYNKDMRRTLRDTDMEPHFTPGTVEDAENTFLDVYCLSKCDVLIHPISNMATAALYFNPNLTSIYLS